jgi:hypothetical protein
MLPDSLDVPTGFAQSTIGLEVAAPIFGKLVCPPLAICLWARGVDGARMPKTTVDKYRNACADKDDIGPSAQVWKNLPVNAEAKPTRMENATHRDLCGGVALPSRLHAVESFR